MGKKKEVVEEPKKEEESEDEDEDTPCIKELKGIDDKYCAIEVELEYEIQKLRKKYDEKQAPLLEERKQVLHDTTSCTDDDKIYGTPACQDFWLQALNNASNMEQMLHGCDEPVLKYLHDITRSFPEEDRLKALKLEFTFKENPFFTNEKLWVEARYDTENYKPYKDIECLEVKSSTIDWKAGKNVTVEKKAKETAAKKGKKKPAKATEEPLPSFFRILFCSLSKGDKLPEALECIYVGEDEEDEDLSDCHLENIGGILQYLVDDFLPYAVRYYTGEIEDDDDDDDDEDEESEEEDDDDDDDEDETPPARGRQGKKPAAKKAAGAAPGEKTEECKQQ